MCDPAISLLDICPKESKSLKTKNTCASTFVAVLFLGGQRWNRPKCWKADGAINHDDVLSYMCNADWILIIYVGHGNRRATVVGERVEPEEVRRVHKSG